MPTSTDYEALALRELEAASKAVESEDRKRHLNQAAAYALKGEKADALLAEIQRRDPDI